MRKADKGAVFMEEIIILGIGKLYKKNCIAS